MPAWLRYAAPQPAMAMDGIAGVKQRAGCPHGCVTQPPSQQWPWMALLA